MQNLSLFEDEEFELPPRPIVALEVVGLFGAFDYQLDLAGDLAILYGDNGTGKTTLLNAVFHLISPGHREGHRTALAQTPFRELRVSLAGGVTISAKRVDRLIGDFTLQWHRNGILEREAPVNTRGSDDFTVPPTEDPVLDEFIERMADLDIHAYMMTEDRTVSGDDLARNEDRRVRRPRFPSWTDEEDVHLTPSQLRDRELQLAVSRTGSLLQRRVIRASNIGDTNAHSIYQSIAERIAGVPVAPSPSDHVRSREINILDRIDQIYDQTQRFAQFGLIPVFEPQRLKAAIDTSQGSARDTIEEVLAPYLDGVEARLLAMRETYLLITKMTERLNGFLRFKTISYDIRRGLRIWDENSGNEIPLAALSSGEKHLLLLFTYVIGATGRRALLLIDEPELSLNVKWQRDLFNALLDLASNSSTQFVVATHSIEMTTHYLDRVARLSPSGS